MQNEIDRIKQFLPFDALKCIKDITKVNEVNFDILKINSIVKIKYFYKIEYTEIIDTAVKIDKATKYIYLKNTKIKFDNIVSIENI